MERGEFLLGTAGVIFFPFALKRHRHIYNDAASGALVLSGSGSSPSLPVPVVQQGRTPVSADPITETF